METIYSKSESAERHAHTHIRGSDRESVCVRVRMGERERDLSPVYGIIGVGFDSKRESAWDGVFMCV